MARWATATTGAAGLSCPCDPDGVLSLRTGRLRRRDFPTDPIVELRLGALCGGLQRFGRRPTRQLRRVTQEISGDGDGADHAYQQNPDQQIAQNARTATARCDHAIRGRCRPWLPSADASGSSMTGANSGSGATGALGAGSGSASPQACAPQWRWPPHGAACRSAPALARNAGDDAGWSDGFRRRRRRRRGRLRLRELAGSALVRCRRPARASGAAEEGRAAALPPRPSRGIVGGRGDAPVLDFRGARSPPRRARLESGWDGRPRTAAAPGSGAG